MCKMWRQQQNKNRQYKSSHRQKERVDMPVDVSLYVYETGNGSSPPAMSLGTEEQVDRSEQFVTAKQHVKFFKHPTDEHNWTWTYSRELKMWLCMDKNGEAKPLAHLEDWLAHPGPAPRNPCSLTCACLTASP